MARPRNTPDKRTEIETALVNQWVGGSRKKLAEKLGVSRSLLNYYVQKLKLTRRKQKGWSR